MAGLTDYITPAYLLTSNVGIDWTSFPDANAAEGDKLAALQEVCSQVTNEVDTVANEIIRATVVTEDEFGPDYTITVQPNGWTRFRFAANTPILQIVSGQVSSAYTNGTPTWTAIPAAAMATEHAIVPSTGSTIPPTATGPTAVLIAPGFVDWSMGRKGYRVQVAVVEGYPIAGIDQTANAAATAIHVDDITGWAGARGTIYDGGQREQVTVASITPDAAGAISGPGTLTLAGALKYEHDPGIGNPDLPDQTILISAMPASLRTASLYFAVHFGLIRGATAAVMQSGRGQIVTSATQPSQDWHTMGEQEIRRWARVL